MLFILTFHFFGQKKVLLDILCSAPQVYNKHTFQTNQPDKLQNNLSLIHIVHKRDKMKMTNRGLNIKIEK